MKKFCALIPLFAALPAFALTFTGCAGTKPVQSVAGEGGSGAIGSGTGGSFGSGGSGGSVARSPGARAIGSRR